MATSAKTEITMSGAAARAVACAIAEFVAAGQGRALERFEVVVVPHDDSHEVIFVPAADPGPSVRGGETSAGREMHVWVSIVDGALLKTSFAR